MSPFGPLAEWQDRLVPGLIDYVGPIILANILSTVFGGFGLFPRASDFGFGVFAGWGLQLAAVAWALYQGHLAGTTGQSMGMKQAGQRLVSESTGQPIGSQQGIVRNLLILPGVLCCGILLLVDALFPLWDPKKQTLRDKIGKSVVVKG